MTAFRTLGGLLVLACSVALAFPEPLAAANEETASVVVRFRPGAVTSQAVDVLAPGIPVFGQRSVAALDMRVLEVPAAHVERSIARLERLTGVEYAEPAYPVETFQAEPDDPWWDHQWGLRRVGAPQAWETTTGSSDVVVAVLDTGVNAHADLPGALLAGRNFVDGQDPADTSDGNGHGTAVAGVIAARGDNGIGIAGVCWACHILPVKVLRDDGTGTTADVVEGIVWAANQGADVINLSFGGPRGGRVLGDAVSYAAERGALLVGAAGNAGTDEKMYPAAYQQVIATAGSQPDDSRYAWSNFGSWVDVAAPGCVITTTAPGDYARGCGTSVAAPLVSGVAALGLSANPDATPVDVRTAVEATAAPVDYVHHGRTRAAATLDALAADREPGAEPAPDPEPEPDPQPEPEPTPLPDVDPVAACPSGDVPPSGFVDLGDTVHRASIECVVWHGIARGYPDGTYRPSRSIQRDQLATFVANALRVAGLELQDPTDGSFEDIDGNGHERSIRQLAELGVVEGRTATTFEPQSLVTRAQMATFLWRAHRVVTGAELPVAERRFDDIDDSVHRDAIDALASAGVVEGRAERTYAPRSTVRRDAMASFVANHLEVLAEAGHVTHP